MSEIEDDKKHLEPMTDYPSAKEGVQTEFEVDNQTFAEIQEEIQDEAAKLITEDDLEKTAKLKDFTEQFSRAQPTYDRIQLAKELAAKEGVSLSPQVEAFIKKLAAKIATKNDNPQQIKRPEEAKKEYEWRLAVYRGDLMLKGFKEEVMPLPIFYEDASRWVDVCGEEDYPLQEKALGILKKHGAEILDIVTPDDSEVLRIYDFGVGNGVKKTIVDNKAIEKNGRHIESHGVDSSREMLFEWVSHFAKDKLREILQIKNNKKVRENSKWRELAEFIHKHDLKYSDNPEKVNRKIKIILDRYFEAREQGEDFDVLKHFFARMLSLRLSVPKKRAMIKELDTKVNLPITITAHPKWFEALANKEFIPAENEGVIIFDLGSEICNKFPGNSLERFVSLLSRPQETGVIPRDKEKGTSANYAVLGLEIGEIPQTQEHFRKIRTRMRKAYNHPPFVSLTTEPFRKGDLTYIDSDTNEEVDFDDIGFLYVDYEEDKDHPEYYMATHRFYITKNIAIYNKNGESMQIPGRESAENVFKKTVDALFDPARDEEVRGRRNAVLRTLNVSSKEELLNVDINRFFSRDYSHYWNGVQLAKGVLDEKNELEQALLYPSYKPTLEQIVNLCHEKGLKVINIYKDKKNNPTYAKILVRKMTSEEIDEYSAQQESGDIDNNVFYVTEK